MKHATDRALDQIDSLLVEIRRYVVLKEKKRGIFYRKSTPFLHFHEDPAGLFADVRDKEDWERFPVNNSSQRKALLSRVKQVLQKDD